MFGWKFLELLHDRTAPEPTLGMLMLSLYKKTKNYSYNLYLFFFATCMKVFWNVRIKGK